MIEAEIVTRRRKWTAAEKAALLAEVEAEGGKVKLVARRHGISESLIYNWRSAWKMAATYTIVQTAKLNDMNSEAYLRDTLAKIAEGHPISRIDELMPWGWQL